LLHALPFSQKDTLRTLAACLPVYGQDNAIAFAVETWEALKVEVSLCWTVYQSPFLR
jgi:hypothetical protein